MHKPRSRPSTQNESIKKFKIKRKPQGMAEKSQIPNRKM